MNNYYVDGFSNYLEKVAGPKSEYAANQLKKDWSNIVEAFKGKEGKTFLTGAGLGSVLGVTSEALRKRNILEKILGVNKKSVRRYVNHAYLGLGLGAAAGAIANEGRKFYRHYSPVKID